MRLLDFFTHKKRTLRDNQWIFGSMLAGAVLSLIASFVLSVDAIKLAANPDVALSCSVNLVLNCASVGLHESAYMFGFPNSFLGLIAEPVVISVAVAGLLGVRFPRSFMFAAQIGYTLGFIFALVLFYISMFIIQALCPWCLLVTATTTFVFFAMTRYNIREANLYLPARVQKKLKIFVDKDYDKLVLWSLIVLMLAAIILKYGADLFS